MRTACTAIVAPAFALVGLLAAAGGCDAGTRTESTSPVVGAVAAPRAPVLRRLNHPPRVAGGGHRLERSGHRVRNYLLEHAQADGGEADANTPFGDFWWIGASSTATSAIPNGGVRMEADVITTPAAAAGGCFSVWTSDVLSNEMWGQIGFSACDIAGYPFYDLTAFFQVWDLSLGPDGELVVDQESNDIAPGLHSFAMYVQSGTTWAYAVDGNVMGAVDMGSATGNAPYGVTTLSEEGDGVAAAFTPPAVAVPVAMEVFSGGAWAPAATADVVNTAGLSGASGQLQDPTLADDQIIIGGTAPTLDSGVPLWNGMATDGGISTVSDAGTLSEPFVQIACPAPNSTVGGKLSIPIAATAAAGVASVTVSVDGATDLDGGSYVALCNLTSPPFTCDWDTTGESDGAYFLYVVVTDTHANATYEDMLVNVDQSAGLPCPEISDAGPVDDAGKDSGSVGDADVGDGGGSDAGQLDASRADAGDGGVRPQGDASNDSGPVVDATSDAPAGGGDQSSSGCGCEAVGGGSFAWGWFHTLWLLGLAALALLRRRVVLPP